MATIISKNFYLTNTQMDDNSGLIGYQNLVTPSTVTATSQLSSDPITSAANPATAWGWVAGDQPAPVDAIEYTGTNLMPSPFDPSGWELNSANVGISTVTQANPSGAPIIGEIEQIGSGTAIFGRSDRPSIIAGETYYGAFIVKQVNYDMDISFFFGNINAANDFHRIVVNVADGTIKTASAGWVGSVKFTLISDGYSLIQISKTYADNAPDAFLEYRLRDESLGLPPIGSKVLMQAAFFGKADDWPAQIQTAGVVPDQTVTINTGGQQVDYIGIAKHNLNQIGLTVTIKYNGITVVPAQPVSEKQALLFLNNIASPDTVELIISGATSPPRIAVLYVGKALRLQRNIYVGHTPISYGRNRTAINGVSENGQYLGEIVVREVNNTSVNLQNLTPDWYRQNLDPFFALSPRPPCFWAWRPSKYEDEVGYCWIEGDPQMSNQRSNGMVQCSWNFKGIV